MSDNLAGLIWVMIAFTYTSAGDSHSAEVAIRHNFLEYAELFFLLGARTCINALLECGSMASIGSAAGVALMGQAVGQYTFLDTCNRCR